MSRRSVEASTPLLSAVAVCAALLVSCGGSDSSPSESASTLLPGREGRPDVSIPTGPPPSKLVVVDLTKGSGRPAEEGDELSVRYFNFAYEGHKIYEDHWDRPPSRFVLGRGERVEAWEDGLVGIRPGGRRELVVPGSKATLENAPEIYVIEALAVTPQREGTSTVPSGGQSVKVKGRGPKPKLRYPPKPPRHVVVRILREGSGPRVRPGDTLAARYVGGSPKTKFEQDFWSEENPYEFELGGNALGEAWVTGLKGMRLGGRRELIVPSRLAYGKGMMVYVIEPLWLERRKPERRG